LNDLFYKFIEEREKMADQLYREKSLKYISSPDQLNDYLKVTKPGVWAVLAAVIILLVGLLIWGNFAYIGSSVEGTAQVEDNSLVMTFDSQEIASHVKEGMTIWVGETENIIISIGKDQKGQIFAVADTDLENGTYDATVTYKKTQVLGLLFGN
jgi:hypothetical protein